MEIDKKAVYWVELSDYDLETASAMLTTKRYLYVGFMCHQCAEKVLKAFYHQKIRDYPPFTHNLMLLATKSGLVKDIPQKWLSLIDELQPLNIEARYPAHKDRLLRTLTPEMCVDLLVQTKEFQQWVKEKF